MSGYLSDQDAAFNLSRAFAPPESEIQTVAAFLSVCPVAGYPGFTETEVHVLGAYRRMFTLSRLPADPWQILLAQEPLGWVMAVHEIVEIEELMKAGFHPFDRARWSVNYPEPHNRATLAELDFAEAWAIQEGLQTSRLALFQENPILRQTLLPSALSTLVAGLRQRTGWNEPTASEITDAQEFWRRVQVAP